MSGRPEVLFPLFAELEGLDGVGPKTAQAFAGLAIQKPRDLLFTLPSAVIDRHLRPSVRDVAPPGIATVDVLIGAHIPARQKGRPYRVLVEDSAQEFQIVFFHARPDYLQRILPTGQRRVVSGKLEVFDGVYQMAHPDYILRSDEVSDLPRFEPVYPLASGINQRLMRRAQASLRPDVPDLPEWIDVAQKEKSGWPTWREALTIAHQPTSTRDLTYDAPARQRLAYDEFLAHQLTLALARLTQRRSKGVSTVGTGAHLARARGALGFTPTSAQTRAIDEIIADMALPRRMNRLLQGDVGSGKTWVAMAGLLTAVICPFAQRVAEFDTGHFRHHPVGQDQIEFDPVAQRQSLDPRGGLKHCEAPIAQAGGDKHALGARVIDNQNIADDLFRRDGCNRRQFDRGKRSGRGHGTPFTTIRAPFWNDRLKNS